MNRILAFLPLALIVAAAPVLAESPIVTLALARPQSSVIRPSRAVPAAENRVEPFALSLTRNLQKDDEIYLSRVPRETANPLVLAGKARETGRQRAVCLEAGFGEIFRDRPAMIYGRNGAGWEEPGCGYLKWSLTF